MAVSYETGTATDPIDLLDKLRLFAIGEGLTISQFADDPGDSNKRLLTILINGTYYTIARIAPGASGSLQADSYALSQHTAFAASTSFGSQTNESPVTSSCTTVSYVTGSISVYHFFYNPGKLLAAAFQMSSGVWGHMGIGDITKYGTYTGGSLIMGNGGSLSSSSYDFPSDSQHSYFGGTSAASAGYTSHRLRVDYQGSNKYYQFNLAASVANRGITNLVMSAFYDDSMFYYSSPSSTRQSTILQPIQFYINDNITTDSYFPVGELADVRLLNMLYFNAGDVFDSDWKIFPLRIKRTWGDGSPNTSDPGYLQHNSSLLGVAYRFQNG